MAMSARKRMTGKRGFTLIEIMVVVAIIVILVGIGIAVGAKVRQSSQEKYTRTTLETLKGTMSVYYSKGNPEPGVNNWMTAFKADPDVATSIKNLKGFNGGSLVDGYDNAIDYIPSTKDATGAIIKGGYFRSPGVDGKVNTKDDVLSDTIAP